MNQYNADKKHFAELFSKFTGVRITKVTDFLKENNISNIFEHAAALDITPIQLEKVNALKQLHNLYGTLKSNDKEYKLNSSVKAGEYFKEYFAGMKEKEQFVCAFLDSQNHIIQTKVISEGTVNEAPVYSREITKLALQYDANSVVLAHNHPGGSIDASLPDKAVTEKISNALSTQNIKVVDHIIVGEGGYFSFAERGYQDLLRPSRASEENREFSVREKLQIIKNKKRVIGTSKVKEKSICIE